MVQETDWNKSDIASAGHADVMPPSRLLLALELRVIPELALYFAALPRAHRLDAARRRPSRYWCCRA